MKGETLNSAIIIQNHRTIIGHDMYMHVHVGNAESGVYTYMHAHARTHDTRVYMTIVHVADSEWVVTCVYMHVAI